MKHKKSRKTIALRDLTWIFTYMISGSGGETGMRTPGTSRYNGFQDRRNRPLCHLSKTPLGALLFKSDAKIGVIFESAKFYSFYFSKYCFLHIFLHVFQTDNLSGKKRQYVWIGTSGRLSKNVKTFQMKRQGVFEELSFYCIWPMVSFVIG